MTTALQLNASGDLVRVNGRFVRTDSTAQRVQTRLRFIRGEWFLDRAAGVPYRSTILRKAPNLDHIRQVLREEILATEGVRTLDELALEYERANRLLRVRFVVNGTEAGSVALN